VKKFSRACDQSIDIDIVYHSCLGSITSIYEIRTIQLHQSLWQCSYPTLELAKTNPPTSSGKPISTNISAPAYLSLTIIGDPQRSLLQIVVQAVAIKTYRVRCAKLSLATNYAASKVSQDLPVSS